MARRLAIIGAGLAGVTIARRLSAHADVTVFEKSRGYGGRMAVRRREVFEWDHGAQYFTARAPQFKAVVESMQAKHAVATWPADAAAPYQGVRRTFEQRYVGQPAMNSFVAGLAGDLDVRFQTEVAAIKGEAGGWSLQSGDGGDLGAFDFVVSTAPAPQTMRLFPARFSGHPMLAEVRMSGCFTLMMGLTSEPEFGASALRPDHPVLSWIAVNTSKPGRLGGPSLVAHSRNDWADVHLEDDRAEVTGAMVTALCEITGKSFADAPEINLHRWRYANVEKPLGQPFLLDADNGLAAAGDWCLGGRVEYAFESGRQLSDCLAEMMVKA